MQRHHFQIVVVFSQLLAIGSTVVQYLTEHLLPPELLGYLNTYETILVPDMISVIELLTDIPFLIQILLGILAAVGLILFRPWGRPVFLVYIASSLLISLISGPHVSTGWTTLVSFACSLIEGAILALVYFSPIQKEFEIRREI